MQPILFELGPLTVYSYGVFVVLGVMAGVGAAYWLARRTKLSLTHFADTALVTVFGALLGARLCYLALRPEEAGSFLNWFALGGGRLALAGGITTGAAALLLMLKRRAERSVPVARWFDIFAIAAVAGLAVGRFGSYLNGDYLGTATGLPWGVTYEIRPALAVAGKTIHPLALYSAALYAAMAAYGYRLQRLPSAARKPGLTGWVIVFLLGVTQVFLEVFHEPSDALRIGNTRAAVLSGLALIATSAYVLYAKYRVGRETGRAGSQR